jgi:hypothetical protein
MANNIEPRLSKATNITTLLANLFVLFFQAVPAILGLLGLISVASQSVNPQLPSTNIRLGLAYQYTLLVSVFLSYLHWLRKYWERNQGYDTSVSNSFARFLLADLPTLKKPGLLIPFLALVVVLRQINPGWFILTILPIVILVALLCFAALDLSYDRDVTKKWVSDENLKQQWIQRIAYRLQSFDAISTEDFQDVGLSVEHDYSQINWALQTYFSKFELEQNLGLTPSERIVDDNNTTLYWKRTLYHKYSNQDQ